MTDAARPGPRVLVVTVVHPPEDARIRHREIAALVAWLMSEDCSFSTGGVFDVSGGRATY